VEKKSVVLSPEQLYIVNRIAGEANLNPQTNTAGGAGEVTSPANSSTFLIHGVTGSGKTEVYMNVIERCLARGFTAIMLVPEIGLTPQMLANFRARFGNVVAMLHSGLSVGERFDEWFRLFSGEAKIAIGARSAVFAPLENLGVIIIDEEHDGSYSAESNPRFNTHDVAEIRARYWHCPVVLGSATPGITSFYRAQKGEYELLKLEKRVNGIEMPRVEIVDMAAEMRAGNAGVFSRVFIERLKAVIEKKQQAIIFLNRRGFFASVMCKNCGWVARCQHCDVSLVFHKADRQLKCHYCSSRFSPVTKCPNCGSTYLKWGAVGTQAVVEEIEKLFPQTPIFRMDGDNVKGRETLIDILDEFGKTRPSILVGTQMVAKGHDFPHVALVGIIDADNSLHFSDFRAIERTFALVSQVAGRSGRAHDVGQVVLQTFIPTHYVYKLAAAGDYKSFYEKEINTRAVTKYPPFSTIVRVLVTAARDDKIKEFLEAIMATLRKRQNEFIYLGAMKSPLGRLDDKFRYQVLCRFDVAREREILDFIDSAVKGHKTQAVQVFMEINPQSLS
jgi:primosomal protein N' (replication factor Y)